MKKLRAAVHTKLFASGFSFLFFISCLLFPVSADAAGPTVGEIEITGLYSIGTEELLYLLDIQQGKEISPEDVRRGIKRAFLKGLFEDISVETVDEEKTKVIIHVKERNRIKNIYVDGDTPITKKALKELFRFKEDQLLKCGLFEKAEKDLDRELAIRGFPHAHVHAEIERLKSPYSINIRLKIDADKPEIIEKIKISGTGEEIKSVMELSEGDVYNRIILKKDIERIKASYKDKEYFRPVVGPYTFKDGTLDISITPGKRLEISLIGNDSVSSKTLLREMPFFEAEDVNEDIIEEAVQRMVSVYHKEGYPFIQIVPVPASADEPIILNFYIFEGPQVEVDKISFIGNSLKEDKLKEILSLKEGKKYNPDRIESDRETLKDFYYALGYLSATVDEFQTEYLEDSQKTDIVIRIQEGLKTVIESISVTGAHFIPEADVRNAIGLKPGDAYNDVDISDARIRIIDLYGAKGYPGAVISLQIAFDGQKAGLTFQINEGTKIEFGRTIITGNIQTKYSVIKRELLQKENQPFDYSLLTKDRQKLYKLGLFTDIDVEVLDRYDHKEDVLMKLREGDAGAVEFSLGYGEYEKYRGMIDLSYRNFMGMNRRVSLRLELNSLAKRYILQYYDPWFLSIDLPFRAFVLGEDKKELNLDTHETLYRLTRHTVSAGFEKKMSETLKSALFYEFSLVNTFDVQPDVVLSREDTGTLIISGLRFGLIYDARDNSFYPTKGNFSGISLKFTSPVFFSETDFVKFSFYSDFYHRVSNRIVLAASVRGGVAEGYRKTNELPIVERFFLGGGTTVRGYAQDTLGPKGDDGNPTGGNAFLMENLEIRTAVTKSIGIVAFLDGGNVWQKVKEINPADFKFTSGLGLRYNTPVGPARVDYGFKLNREKGESIGELHFSIGHAF